MIPKEDFQRLMDLKEKQILSLYLHTDPAKAEGSKAYGLTWLKGALKDLQARASQEDQGIFSQLKRKVQRHVQNLRPKGKSLILFSGENVFEEFHLQVSVKNEVWWGRPSLTQLEWILEEFKPYGVILADSERVKFFIVHLNEVQESSEITLDLETKDWRRKDLQAPPTPRGSLVRGSVRGGSQRDLFADRREVQVRKFWEGVPPILDRLKQEYGLENLVLGGPQSVQERFWQSLRKQDQEKIIGRTSLRVEAPPAKLLETSLAIIQDYERKEEEKSLKVLLERTSRSDRAGMGLGPTLKALQDGKVAQVVVAKDFDASLQECLACGYAIAQPVETCPRCSARRLHETSLRALLPTLLRKYGTDLEVLGAEAAKTLTAYGGIGSLWRY